MMGLGYAHSGFGPVGLSGLGGALGAIVLVAFVAVVVLLLVSGTRRHHAVAAESPASDPAIQIARERFARGEMDAEQYARIVASLSGANRPPT